eukprot:scaffold81603_cov45-Phaeocystis_antarctica.AAC.1
MRCASVISTTRRPCTWLGSGLASGLGLGPSPPRAARAPTRRNGSTAAAAATAARRRARRPG